MYLDILLCIIQFPYSPKNKGFQLTKIVKYRLQSRGTSCKMYILKKKNSVNKGIYFYNYVQYGDLSE